MVLGAYAGFCARKWPTIARRFFDGRWIDAPVQARQGAWRLLASDRALGPPLRSPELPGQDRGTS